MRWIAAGFCSLLALGACAELTINTTAGQILGVEYALDATRVWLGVPFAAPPVGELRFASPVAHPPWPGVRNATTAASKCLQKTGGDEDW